MSQRPESDPSDGRLAQELEDSLQEKQAGDRYDAHSKDQGEPGMGAHSQEPVAPPSHANGQSPSAALDIAEPPLSFWKRCPLTTGFSILLLLVYAVVSYPNQFQAPTEAVLYWGAFLPTAIDQGQWWRFLTATLLHANLPHLFNNVVGILIFGNLLEPVIRSSRLLILYIASAAWGLALSYWMLPHGTLGASTIDYGLIGAYLGLVLLIRYGEDQKSFLQELRGAVTFVVIFVIWNTLESGTINLWAHVGGFAAGVAFALWMWGQLHRAIRRGG